MASDQKLKKRTPPYVAYKTFKSSIAGLDHVPDTIDYSMYDRMNGSARTLLFGALKFFELIDDKEKPSQEFRRLAGGEGEAWNGTLKSLIERHYADQLSFLKSGTVASLKRSFGDEIGPSIVSPACRFLMQAAQDVGLPVSPSIAKGKFGSAPPLNRRKKKAPTPQTSNGSGGGHTTKTLSETVRFPIPIAGKLAGEISVPKNLTEADLPMLKAMFAAVEQYAKQNVDQEGGVV